MDRSKPQHGEFGQRSRQDPLLKCSGFRLGPIRLLQLGFPRGRDSGDAESDKIFVRFVYARSSDLANLYSITFSLFHNHQMGIL